MKKKIDYNINFLRVVAIILVILLHTNANYLMQIQNSDFGVISNILIISISVITRIAVPIFVLISGRYVISSLENMPIKEFYKKRVMRLIYPMVFWSILFGIISLIFLPETTVKDYIFDFVSGFANNMVAIHIWYLFMLLGLYVVSPVIYKIIKNINAKKMITLGVILTLGGFGVEIIKNTTHINLWILWWLEFLGLFILGYALKGIKVKRTSFIVISLISVEIISNAVCCYLFSIGSNLGMVFFWGLTPTTTFTAVMVYLYFENKSMKNSLISQKSKYVLGIYLFHPIILILLKNLSVANPIIDIVLKTGVVFMISLLVMKVLYRIKFMKKFIS